MKMLMFFLVLSLASCAKLSSTQSSAPGAGSATYTELYSSVLESKCQSCHNSSSPAGGVDVSTYENLVSSASLVSRDPEASTFYTQVLSGQMPQGQPALAYNEIENIRIWIASGLPEGGGSTNPPAPAATFTQVNQEILQPLCSSCHSGSTPSGSYSVVNYANVMSRVTANTPLASLLYTRVADDSMPKSGPLTDTQKAMIESWINAGALNN